jgi:hypothetical protein
MYHPFIRHYTVLAIEKASLNKLEIKNKYNSTVAPYSYITWEYKQARWWPQSSDTISPHKRSNLHHIKALPTRPHFFKIYRSLSNSVVQKKMIAFNAYKQ